MDDAKIACAALVVISHHLKTKEKKRCKRKSHWVTPLLRSRETYGGNELLRDLRLGTNWQFKNFCRMSSQDFGYLLGLIERSIMKRDTNYRRAISAKERLAITLRFLATGDSFTSLMYLFKVSKQCISSIVTDVCHALNDVLKHNIKLPNSQEEWLKCSDEFDYKWNYPHCLAAMDGKHVMLQAPIDSGSEYFNYKSFFSIVLFALVDANYNFLFADVGGQGRISDGGIFKNSVLWKKIQENSLNIPEPKALDKKSVPYVILGDEAFALHDNIMKPYAGVFKKGSRERIFNYRLSRARRVVENAFGILSVVFRVLRKPMLLQPEKARDIVLTTIYLHNFLRQSKTSGNLYSPPGTFDSEKSDGTVVEGTWRSEVEQTAFSNLKKIPRKPTASAQNVRNEFAAYFMSNKGRLNWQDDY